MKKELEIKELAYQYSKHRFDKSIVPTIRKVFEEVYSMAQPKWINVKTAPPKEKGYYLVAHIEGGKELTSRSYYYGEDIGDGVKWSDYWWSITHYQPLPSPPTQ